jgi:tryptophan synthase alpha subunit
VAPIFLLSPHTRAAHHRHWQVARGYVYTCRSGVTGATHLDTADVARNLAAIRRICYPWGRFWHSRRGSAQAIAAHAMRW